METAEITKTTKKTTFKQVVKAIKAYALSKGEKFVQVEEHYSCTLFDEEKQTFRAYINGFDIFAIADNIPELIKQFEDAKAGIKPKVIDDLDGLPF